MHKSCPLSDRQFDACPGLIKTKDCLSFSQDHRVWPKQTIATDYDREKIDGRSGNPGRAQALSRWKNEKRRESCKRE